MVYTNKMEFFSKEYILIYTVKAYPLLRENRNKTLIR